jgi:large subunit ribosomal protein L20
MRVKKGPTRSRRHHKIASEASKRGFRGFRGRTIKGAKEGLQHALTNSYKSRKMHTRQMRTLWINRISAAVKNQGLSYSQFISKLKQADIVLNRKVLSEIAMYQPEVFDKLVKTIV